MRFGPDPQQRVTAFIPREPGPGPWVYFLFGGGWTNGSITSWSFAGNWFARHGIPAVLGGYRLAPAHRFPASLQDALMGYEFSTGHAEELGIQARSAVLAGASAGGHLAALATIELARKRCARSADDLVVLPDGLLTVNAPLDLMETMMPSGTAAIETLTGHGRPWPEADALTRLISDPGASDLMPRTMLVQGQLDELVSPVVAQHFADALNDLAPGRAVVVDAAWKEHSDLTRLFLDRDPQLSARVIDWLRAVGPVG